MTKQRKKTKPLEYTTLFIQQELKKLSNFICVPPSLIEFFYFSTQVLELV